LRLNWHSPAEQPDKVDDQNNYDHQLQHKCAALMELVDHEAIEFLRRMDFLVDEIFVVRDTDFRGRYFVQARREHIAQKFNGVVSALSEFVNIEQHRVKTGGAFRGAPAGSDPRRTILHEVVNALEFTGQQLVVVPELEQL